MGGGGVKEEMWKKELKMEKYEYVKTWRHGLVNSVTNINYTMRRIYEYKI